MSVKGLDNLVVELFCFVLEENELSPELFQKERNWLSLHFSLNDVVQQIEDVAITDFSPVVHFGAQAFGDLLGDFLGEKLLLRSSDIAHTFN